MQAEITVENDDGIGVDVTDNNGVTHKIDLGSENWDIVYHEQDGYPDDPGERQWGENEHINQAKRYARYYVSRERGYETLTPRKDPANIAATALVLADLDTPWVTEYFGDLLQQVGFHETGAEPVVSLPAGLSPDKATYYQDIYLDLDAETRTSLQAITSQQGDILEIVQDAIQSDTELSGVLADEATSGTPLGNSPAPTLIEAVSGIHICWADETNQYQVERHGDPDLDREPDARLELMPFVPDGTEAFRLRLVRHLFCQARDRYIAMGVTPPAPFRLQGVGLYDFTLWYNNREFYQPYYDETATIDWEIEPPQHRSD